MSGFERAEDGDAWTEGITAEESAFPDDFSVEEAEFANELRGLFALDREELPPLYTQTLLEDERLRVLERGYEQKITYRVMRRLHLRREPLFRRNSLALVFSALGESLLRASRPLVASLATVMFMMALIATNASPAFTAGVRILLGQSGVQQVPTYPANVRTSLARHESGHHFVGFDRNMPLSWLGSVNGNYLYQDVRLQEPTEFSKGPIVEMQYSLENRGSSEGVIDIREFQVNSKYAAVLQVVQDGSQSLVKFGDTPAVYVDGAWVQANEGHHILYSEDQQLSWRWQTGTRSELIFERAGVVYWIVGDQRAGIQQSELLRIAGLLKPATPKDLVPNRLTLRIAGNSLTYSFIDPIGHEVYAEVASGTSPGTGAAAFVSS